MIKRILLALALTALPAGLAAQTSAPAAAPAPAALAKARELMTVMHADELMRKTLDAQLSATTKGLAGQILASTGAAPPEFQAIMQRFLDRVMAGASTQVKGALPQIIERMTAAYALNFNAAQLADIIAFYRSPTGQVFLDRTPALTAQIGEMTRELTMGPIMNVVRQEMPQFKAEVEAWEAKHPQAAGTKQ